MTDNYDEIIQKASDLFNNGDYVSAVDTIDAIENMPPKVLDFKYKMLADIAQICEKSNDIHSHLYCLTEMDRIKPDNEKVLLSIAFDLERISDLPHALIYYEKVLNINKRNYDALIHIALLFIRVNKDKNAEIYIEKAKRAKPNQYKTAYAYFKIYENRIDFKEALRYAKEMADLKPNNPDSYYHCARTYYHLFDYKTAIEYCDKILKLEPDNIDIMCLKLECLERTGEKDVSSLYENLLSRYPESYTLKRFYFSHALKQKNFSEISKYWLDVHSPTLIRQDRGNVAEKFTEYEKKRWNRENLSNKTLLIHQGTFGAGDFIMFSRYIPFIEKSAGKVIIETAKNFIELFKYNFTKSVIIEETKNSIPENSYDYSVSCMDLFYNTNFGFDNIPFNEGWLNIPEQKILEVKNTAIFNTSKKKIGIFWRGSGGTAKFRNIDLKKFIPLFECENCKFYSFDIEPKDTEMLEIFEKYNIQDCSKYIKNAIDTSAFLKNIDVLITVDSFPLHLAGALGVNAYLCLPVFADWRWFDDYKTTPWYKSVEIFRSTETENTDVIINKIKEKLLTL